MRRCGLVSTNPLEIPVLSWDLGYGASVTDRALKAGTIFRTRIFGQFQVLPARPPAHSGFTLITRFVSWSVYERCAGPGSTRRPARA